MCDFVRKLQGVTICGRSVYRTDTGLKLGYKGPQVLTGAFLADLSPTAAQAVQDAINTDEAAQEQEVHEEQAAEVFDLVTAAEGQEIHEEQENQRANEEARDWFGLLKQDNGMDDLS